MRSSYESPQVLRCSNAGHCDWWGGLILLARVQHGPFPASAADNYNACLQDAKIGMLEHKSDFAWFDNALAKCAKRYRVEREKGQ